MQYFVQMKQIKIIFKKLWCKYLHKQKLIETFVWLWYNIFENSNHDYVNIILCSVYVKLPKEKERRINDLKMLFEGIIIGGGSISQGNFKSIKIIY